MKFNLYDFDGTIYDGDSGIDMMLFAMKKYPKIIIPSFWSLFLYIVKIIDKVEFKSRIFSFVKYVTNLDVFVSEFWKKYDYKIKKFWIEKKDHHNDIIISASCDFWLMPFAKKYGVADLFSTVIDIKNGCVIGENCHGEEKVRRFYNKYPNGKILSMYTDSSHDYPLIKKANKGFFVKKNKIYDYSEYMKLKFQKNNFFRHDNNKEIFNYLIVGMLTVMINMIVKWLLWFTICNPTINDYLNQQFPVDLSWIIAVLFAYIANRIYVFESKNSKILKEFLCFFVSRFITLLIEKVLTFVFLTILLFNTNLLIIIQTIVIQGIIIVLNYLLSKIIVFRK